jgi:hypothetical protein
MHKVCHTMMEGKQGGPSIKYVTLRWRGNGGPSIKYVILQMEGKRGAVHKVCHTTEGLGETDGGPGVEGGPGRA